MRMKKWMGVLGLAALMAFGIPGNAGSGLSMTAQAAGSGEAAGDVRVFDQAGSFSWRKRKKSSNRPLTPSGKRWIWMRRW